MVSENVELFGRIHFLKYLFYPKIHLNKLLLQMYQIRFKIFFNSYINLSYAVVNLLTF